MHWEIIKCKEYYIDCVNYHSWNLKNICLTQQSFIHYINLPKSDQQLIKCPYNVRLLKGFNFWFILLCYWMYTITFTLALSLFNTMSMNRIIIFNYYI